MNHKFKSLLDDVGRFINGNDVYRYDICEVCSLEVINYNEINYDFFRLNGKDIYIFGN